MENVKALTQKKFLPFLHKWQRILEDYGYQNFTQVLNAKHYGIPQNRERVFMVSIREDECVSYQFPQPFPLTLKLADVLEEHVADNFFLRDEMLARFCEKSLEMRNEQYPHNTAQGGVCYTLNTRYEDAAVSDYTHAKHAKTCVMAVHESV